MNKQIITFLTLLSSLFLKISAQHLGIGINPPIGTLHVHETIPYENGSIVSPLLNGNNQTFLHNYKSIIHITNPNCGISLSDGFTIIQNNLNTTIQQNENENLKILGYNGNGITISTFGNIGIGTDHPDNTTKLHIVGNEKIEGNLILIEDLYSRNINANGTLNISGQTNLGSGFICYHDGRVKCKEIEITLENWPDFVFDSNYHLMNIHSLEKFIKEKKHLPNIPSKEDINTQNLNIGEINFLLLQKIEELTLYIIDLQKQIDELKCSTIKK